MVFRKTIDPAFAHTLPPPIITSHSTDDSHMVPTSVRHSISKSDAHPRKRARSTLSGKRNPNEYHMVRCCHCTHTWGTYGGRFQDLIWSRDLHQSSRHQRGRSRRPRTSAYRAVADTIEQCRNSRQCCPAQLVKRVVRCHRKPHSTVPSSTGVASDAG